jgi:nucleoside-diphosphate-sugar epimerase
MRILVTGGGGFIGSHLAKRLHDEGHFVRVADIKYDGYLDTYWSQQMLLDLRDLQNCLDATKGIEQVYNLAANMGGIGYITSVLADVISDNGLIDLNMLKACRLNGVSRFLFSSSACVYPNFKQKTPIVDGLKETDAYPSDPNEPYGCEKLFMEEACAAYRRNNILDVRIARYHNIFGQEGTYEGGKEKAPAAICRKVAVASDPGVIELWGDGKATRSYCYIDDCVEGTIRLMNSSFYKPVNIGSDRLVSVDGLADIIIGISGKNIAKKYNLTGPQGVRGRNADLSLARLVLDWEPKVSLEDGLERTYRWIEKMVRVKV